MSVRPAVRTPTAGGRRPSRVGGFSARFAGVVFPGDTIQVRTWDEGERIVVSATVDDRPVLADCLLWKA